MSSIRQTDAQRFRQDRMSAASEDNLVLSVPVAKTPTYEYYGFVMYLLSFIGFGKETVLEL
jgi:hypothetical protein